MSPGEMETFVRGLDAMNLEALRQVWRERFGRPPTLRSADLLRRNLAWRVQAQSMGGFDPETQRLIFSKSRPSLGPALAPGMRLAREWRGVRHEVEVVEEGVRYRGRVLASLSQVAREITGVRWNGPRFFGLRPSGAGK